MHLKKLKWIQKRCYIILFFKFILHTLCAEKNFTQQHTNNWAVLISTSRFWFNYRHEANTLSIYHTVKRLGIPDSHIILMMADDMPCNARNPFPGEIYNNQAMKINLYGEDVEVDYRGSEVTVENFLRLLTGRTLPGHPPSKQLNTDKHSNILIFMSGHGGDEFLKFQDTEEISSNDIADAIEEMRIKDRYNEILFITETCQAGSLGNALYSKGVLAVGSSRRGEHSYSHHGQPAIGVAVIDRFTYATLDFFERRVRPGSVASNKQVSLDQLLKSYKYEELKSTVDVRQDLYDRSLRDVLVTDFFGSVLHIELTDDSYPLAI